MGAAEIPDELTLQLRKRITIGTVEYSELKLCEPTAGELLKAGKAASAIDQLMTLVQINAKVPRGMVEEMSQRDLQDAGSFFDLFYPRPPKTSET